MIVKKMPILQGFPDFETVKKLSNFYAEKSDFIPLFYDIETTGLARNSTFLYLVGGAVYEDNSWQFFQYFAQTPEEEPLLLREFAQTLDKCTHTVQYNGNHFDQPYLSARFQTYDLTSPFANQQSLDLYQELKPLKTLLKLPDLKQPTVEGFLRLPQRKSVTGKECIRLYREYVKKPEAGLAEGILLHNEEDIQGLGRVFEMLSYRSLLQGEYEVTVCSLTEDTLLLSLQLPHLLPTEFSNGSELFYITGKGREIRLKIWAPQGRLRRYYENFRDYDYLVMEDMAMPRVLTGSVDGNLKRPATPDTCYTWFFCGEDFLASPKLQKEYLVHALPVFLKTLR